MTQTIGKNSQVTAEQIAQAFGNEARAVSTIWKTAGGRYVKGKNWAQGSSLNPSDISSIKAKIVLQEVFGLERKMYQLEQLVTARPFDKLTGSFYVASQGSAHRKLAKGQEPDILLNRWLKVDVNLWTNAAHVAMFDEDQAVADVPIYSIGKEDAAGALAYAKNLDISDELANATDISTGHDWGEMTTSPNSDHDPTIDIAGGIAALHKGGSTNGNVKANPTVLAMGDDAYIDFITNSWIQKYVQAGMIKVPAPGAPTGGLALPMFPNLTLVVDGDISPSTSAFVVDPKYFVLATGPMNSVGYRNDLKRMDGYALFEYLEPKLVTDQSATYTVGARELTGIHA